MEGICLVEGPAPWTLLEAERPLRRLGWMSRQEKWQPRPDGDRVGNLGGVPDTAGTGVDD